RQESVADHTWRLCLLALIVHDRYPHVDFARLIKICIVHDLGEAVGGDIPAPEQAKSGAKAEQERRDLLELLGPLSASQRNEIVPLWDEYEPAPPPEERLEKRSTNSRLSFSIRRVQIRRTSITASTWTTAVASRREIPSSRQSARH